MSWIEEAIWGLNNTLSAKNEDYRIDGEFSNFQYSADVAGVSIQDVMLTQIAIKLGRLHGLRRSAEDYSKAPNFEGIEDTMKDLAGYAVILYAHQLSLEIDHDL